jgi:hypothetical protein
MPKDCAKTEYFMIFLFFVSAVQIRSTAKVVHNPQLYPIRTAVCGRCRALEEADLPATYERSDELCIIDTLRALLLACVDVSVFGRPFFCRRFVQDNLDSVSLVLFYLVV